MGPQRDRALRHPRGPRRGALSGPPRVIAPRPSPSSVLSTRLARGKIDAGVEGHAAARDQRRSEHGGRRNRPDAVGPPRAAMPGSVSPARSQ